MRNPGFSYNDYLTGLEKGIQAESEKLLTTQNRSYPATMRTAVAMAARQLACDPIMEMVSCIPLYHLVYCIMMFARLVFALNSFKFF